MPSSAGKEEGGVDGDGDGLAGGAVDVAHGELVGLRVAVVECFGRGLAVVTLFPYTTLFRSEGEVAVGAGQRGRSDGGEMILAGVDVVHGQRAARRGVARRRRGQIGRAHV